MFIFGHMSLLEGKMMGLLVMALVSGLRDNWEVTLDWLSELPLLSLDPV